MELITGMLTKNELRSDKFLLVDRNIVPDREKCLCGLLKNWYWLASDSEQCFSSRWMTHLCLCEIIKVISQSLNDIISQREVIKREIDNNDFTKKYSKNREEYLSRVFQTFGSVVEEKQRLLAQLKALTKKSDPNSEYLKIRLDLARNYTAWRELFDCKDEKEAKEVLTGLYPDGHDKFTLAMEQLSL